MVERGIARTSVIMTVLTMLNMVASLLMQIAIAYVFGAGWQTDAYFAAWTLPFLIGTLAGEPIGLAMIPILSELKARGEARDVRRLVTAAFAGVSVAVLIVGAGVVLMRERLLEATVPGFSREQLALTARLLPMTIGSSGLGIVVAVLSYLYYFEGRFTLVPWFNFIPPLFVVAFSVSLGPRLGITSAALGALVGSVLTFALMLPILSNYLTREPVPRAGLRTLGWHAFLIGLSMLPISVSPLIDRYLASSLPQGSISYLAYSWTLSVAVASLMSRGVLTTLFPSLSVRVQGPQAGFQRLAATMLLVLLLVSVSVVPAAIFLRRPILRVVMMRGRVTAVDLDMISKVLQWHFLSVVGIVFLNALNRINYALGWIRLAVAGSLVQVGVYFVAAVVLSSRYAIVGLAMANGLAWIVASMALVAVLAWRGQLGERGALGTSAASIGLAGGSLVMALFLLSRAVATGSAWLVPLGLAGGAGYVFFAIRSLGRLGLTLRSLRGML